MTGLVASIHKAARVLSRRSDAALQPLGINSRQLTLLTCIDVAMPPSIGDVAASLAMDRTTVTANLEPLVRRKLVAVVSDEGDAGLRLLSLTKDGRALLARALPIFHGSNAAIVHMTA